MNLKSYVYWTPSASTLVSAHEAWQARGLGIREIGANGCLRRIQALHRDAAGCFSFDPDSRVRNWLLTSAVNRSTLAAAIPVGRQTVTRWLSRAYSFSLAHAFALVQLFGTTLDRVLYSDESCRDTRTGDRRPLRWTESWRWLMRHTPPKLRDLIVDESLARTWCSGSVPSLRNAWAVAVRVGQPLHALALGGVRKVTSMHVPRKPVGDRKYAGVRALLRSGDLTVDVETGHLRHRGRFIVGCVGKRCGPRLSLRTPHGMFQGLKSRVVYTAVYGDIPHGHKVIHVNGDLCDTRPDNLRAVPNSVKA